MRAPVQQSVVLLTIILVVPWHMCAAMFHSHILLEVIPLELNRGPTIWVGAGKKQGLRNRRSATQCLQSSLMSSGSSTYRGHAPTCAIDGWSCV